MTERAYQQYTRVVPAKGAVNLPAFGEFIYCAVADRPLVVTVGSQSVEMQAGDKGRFNSPFRNVELHNPTDTAVRVRFIIGWGDYERQIIQGEVSVAPGVRKADGTFADDTRTALDLYFRGDWGRLAVAVSAGDAERFWSESNATAKRCYALALDRKARRWYSGEQNDPTLYVYDDAGALVKSYAVQDAGGTPFNPDTGLAFDGEWLYVTNEDDNWNIYRWKPGGVGSTATFEHYLDNPLPELGGLRALRLDYDPESDQFVANDQAADEDVYVFNRQGAGKKLVTVPDAPSGIAFFGGEVLVLTNQRELWRYDTEGNLIAGPVTCTFGANYAAAGPLVRDGTRLRVAAYNSSGPASQVWTLEPLTIASALYGEVGSARCDAAAGLVRGALNTGNRTRAALTVDADQAPAVIRGEIIRAALELYLGRYVNGDDYLDAVFGIEVPTQNPPLALNSAGASFKRVGIADQFELELPGRLRLILDRAAIQGAI